MKRIIGLKGGAKGKPPQRTVDDVVESTSRKATVLDQKIIECDNELRRIQQQLKNLPSGASKQGLQTKAKNILVRKKRFEQQAETYREKAFNIDSLADSIKAAEDIKVVAGVMKNGVKQLKNDLQKIDLDKIENCQQELNDLIDMTDEVEAAIQRSYEIPQDIDDDELNAQLELLGDEIVLDSDPSYIDAVLHSPEVASISGIDKKVTPSNAPRASNVDEFGLPILCLDKEKDDKPAVNK